MNVSQVSVRGLLGNEETEAAFLSDRAGRLLEVGGLCLGGGVVSRGASPSLWAGILGLMSGVLRWVWGWTGSRRGKRAGAGSVQRAAALVQRGGGVGFAVGGDVWGMLWEGK